MAALCRRGRRCNSLWSPERAARRRTPARYSAFGNQARHSRRDLDRGRYRSPSIAGHGMGLAARRECGAHGHGGQHSDRQGLPRTRQCRARKHRGRFDPKAWLQAGDTGRGADRARPSRGAVIVAFWGGERRDSRNVTSDLIGSGSFQRSRLNEHCGLKHCARGAEEVVLIRPRIPEQAWRADDSA